MSYEDQPQPYFEGEPQFREHKFGGRLVQSAMKQQQQLAQLAETAEERSRRWEAFDASNRAVSKLTGEAGCTD